MLDEFKQFIARGNAIDLAVGVVIGASFTKVVDALVKGVLEPLIALIARVPDFSGFVLAFGGSAFRFGDLINALISFLIVALAIFFVVVKPMNLLAKKK